MSTGTDDNLEDIPEVGRIDVNTLLARRPRLLKPANLTKPKPTRHPRLTVLETIYYQAQGGSPTKWDGNFSQECLSGQEPSQPPAITVGPEWTEIDLYWLKEVGQLCLLNNEGNFNRRPTEREREEAMTRVVEVAFEGVCSILLRPTQSARFEPVNLKSVRLRCPSGTAKVFVAGLPR